jgi:hypothetical protein
LPVTRRLCFCEHTTPHSQLDVCASELTVKSFRDCLCTQSTVDTTAERGHATWTEAAAHIQCLVALVRLPLRAWLHDAARAPCSPTQGHAGVHRSAKPRFRSLKLSLRAVNCTRLRPAALAAPQAYVVSLCCTRV